MALIAEFFDGFAAVAGLPDERHVRLACEYRGDAVAQQRMIVDGENPDHCVAPSQKRMRRGAARDRLYATSAGTRKSTSVPAPGLLHTSR